MTGAGRREDGSAAISFIFAIPIVLIMLFGIIEVGWAMKTRALVQGVTRDVTRGAAADGGNCNGKTSTNAGVPDENGTTRADWCGRQAWSRTGTNLLRAQYVKQFNAPPGVTCTPEIADRAGAEVRCTATYPYKALTPMFRGGWNDALGINKILGTFTVTYEVHAQTGDGA